MFRAQSLVWGAAVVVVGAVLYQVLRNGKAIGAALDTVNPFNANNAIYRGVSNVTGAVLGSTAPTLGGQLADIFQPDPNKVLDQMARSPRVNAAEIVPFINQMNPNALPPSYYYW